MNKKVPNSTLTIFNRKIPTTTPYLVIRYAPIGLSSIAPALMIDTVPM